ncbi:MAG: magnesium transporter [Verrucomicrobiota bacterium]|nr:magnesium transporter [Opitutales bacterium]UPA28740.1 MAG: magnesium transporter [Verrucomicrobiota bacterium]
MPNAIHSHAAARKLAQYSLEELMVFADGALDQIDPIKLSNTSPYEVGCFLERLSPEDQQFLLKKLSSSDASEVLAEMMPCDSAEILTEMRDHRAVKILQELEPDDAVDLLLNVEIKDRERLLSKLPKDFADTIRDLMCYDPNTAGGVMTPYVTTIRDTMTVDDAIQYVRREKNETENTDQLFVVDQHRCLVGSTTVRNLIWAKSQQRVADIMERDIPGICKPDESKQDVALAMTESHAQILPVVDNQGRLLGIITHDDVIDILHEAATSDMQKLCGAGGDEHVTDSVWYSVTKRAPWLIANLFLSLVSTGIISDFSDRIAEAALLAAFLNLVTVLSDNAGSQSLAVSIRALALGELLPSDIKQIYAKEAIKGLLNGIIIGAVAAIVAVIWTKDGMMGLLVFLALVITVVFAGILGAFVPIALKKLKLDPANSSAIILTALVEPVTILIFLWLGTRLVCPPAA